MEVAYVRAVAWRYTTMDQKQPPDAWAKTMMQTTPDLQVLIDDAIADDDYFALCRLELEMGLVHLSAGYALALGTEHAEMARSTIEAGIDHVETTIRMLGVDGLQELSGISRRYLFAEVIVGLAGGAIYASLIDTKPWQGMSRKWGPLADHARRLMADARDIVPDIYTLAPDLLELANERDPDAFAAQRQSILGQMAQFQKAEGNDRTALDIEAMKLVEKRVMQSAPEQRQG